MNEKDPDESVLNEEAGLEGGNPIALQDDLNKNDDNDMFEEDDAQRTPKAKKKKKKVRFLVDLTCF